MGVACLYVHCNHYLLNLYSASVSTRDSLCIFFPRKLRLAIQLLIAVFDDAKCCLDCMFANRHTLGCASGHQNSPHCFLRHD